MTTIHDIIAADLAATAFDDTVDETPVTEITWDPDGDNITCNAIVGSKSVDPEYDDGEDHVETCPVTVLTADIAEALIQVGVVVVIGADTWKVVAVEKAGFGSARVRVAKKVAVARADAGFKKRMV